MSGEDVRAAAEKVFQEDNMFAGRVLPQAMPKMSLEMDLPSMVPPNL